MTDDDLDEFEDPSNIPDDGGRCELCGRKSYGERYCPKHEDDAADWDEADAQDRDRRSGWLDYWRAG